MKKQLAMLLIVAMLLGLAGCASGYRENSWFSQDYLQEYLVADLPTPSGCDFVVRSDTAWFYMNNDEFDSYLQSVFTYLQQQNFLYFGTRGEQINTLAGALTSYYFQETDCLEEFYVDDGYRFVFSDGSLDQDGDVIFHIVLIFRYSSKTLEYGKKKLTYNTQFCLCTGSETELNGFYVLPEE